MSATSTGEWFQRIRAATRAAVAVAEAVETIRIIAVVIVTMTECKLLVPFFFHYFYKLESCSFVRVLMTDVSLFGLHSCQKLVFALHPHTLNSDERLFVIFARLVIDISAIFFLSSTFQLQ